MSKPYIDITLELMRRFGVAVDAQADYQGFRVPTAGYRSPGRYLVEGDASSATYFLAAGAIRGDGIRVRGIGADCIQGDLAFTDVLEEMGARVTKRDDRIEVAAGRLKGIEADLNHIPDAAMTVAVLALFAEGRTRIGNIYNWRVKETDRLAAMAQELRKARGRRRRRRGLPGNRPARPPAARRHQHLRRPSHGDVFLTGRAWRRARYH